MAKPSSVSMRKLAEAFNSGGLYEMNLQANGSGFHVDKELEEEVIELADVIHIEGQKMFQEAVKVYNETPVKI